MNQEFIKKQLNEFNEVDIDKYISYCIKLQIEKDKKTGKLKNFWATKISDDKFIEFFKRINNVGLVFDGEHVTLQSTGITLDYIAYKNKMLLTYPESIIDVQLVYKEDDFKFKKQNGQVLYTHELNNPFAQSDSDIIGAYVVIKNKRGEFLTTLSKAEIDKHRKVAKTDYIWANWFKEMALKTVMKKACKTHFNDIYQNVETIDNENYDLDLPLDVDIEIKQAIENINDNDTLDSYYLANKNEVKNLKAFTELCSKRRGDINANSK